MPLHRFVLVAVPFLLLAPACTTRDDSHGSRNDSGGVARVPQSPAGATSTTAEITDAPGPSTSENRMEYYPAAMLDHVAESLARGSSSGHVLGVHGGFQYLFSRRVTSGAPEIHEQWVDVTTIQSGRATLVYGGRVRGGQADAGGEHRGGTISGGSTRPVQPGDLMIIPAGMPHQYQIAHGDSLRYVTIKVPAGSH